MRELTFDEIGQLGGGEDVGIDGTPDASEAAGSILECIVILGEEIFDYLNGDGASRIDGDVPFEEEIDLPLIEFEKSPPSPSKIEGPTRSEVPPLPQCSCDFI